MEIWGGIECTINRVKNQYFDQLDYQGHYKRKGDLKLVCDLGIKKIRYPVLWEKHQPEEDSIINWAATASSLDYLKERNVEVIAGLVHHGCGPAFVEVMEDSFAEGLAAYAEKVALKFPWINYYTPVNEPLTTARFSALYGIWYPHKGDNASFFKMLVNECKATVLAMLAIRKVNPAAQLVQTEDLGKIHSTAVLKYQADFENQRRWLSIDLLCGYVNETHPLWNFMLDSGLKKSDLEFFITHPMPPDILGFNYYITSERFLDENTALYPAHSHGGNGVHGYADIEAVRTSQVNIDGPQKLLKAAWERYHLPMAITEAHLHCGREDQLRWLQYIWNESRQLKNTGVNLVGVTAWSLFGAYGWNELLTTANGSYEAGAFDVQSGMPRPTALTKQIKGLAGQLSFHHPVLDCPGWWGRQSRIIYGGGNALKPAPPVYRNCKPVLIIGAAGTLGKAFVKLCEERSIYYKTLTRSQLNLADPMAIEKIIKDHQPWAIINAAGFVRVDDAEFEHESCYLSNTTGPANLALSCRKHGVKLLTFSSDFVFDGKKQACYVERDEVNPLNVYGRSKAKAEQQVLLHDPNALIIRTSAFFSPWDTHNFVYHITHALNKGKPIKVANDVFISPTYVPDLVNISLDFLIDDAHGIWHVANDGVLSWSELAKEVASRGAYNPACLQSVPVNEIGFPAIRPAFSALKSDKGIVMPTLGDALSRYFNAVGV
ncbi:MAG: dTDP-4-dehydrorhamnose reductase [Bacteroidota bacterium]